MTPQLLLVSGICSLVCRFTESNNFTSHEWHNELTISCHKEIKSRGAPWKQSLKNPLNVFQPLSNHPLSAREPNGQRCRYAHHRYEMRSSGSYWTANFHSRSAQTYLAQGIVSPRSVKRKMRTFNSFPALQFPCAPFFPLVSLYWILTCCVAWKLPFYYTARNYLKGLDQTNFAGLSLLLRQTSKEAIQNSNTKELMNKISI